MGVDPTQPLTLTLTLAPYLNPTQSGPETGENRSCAAFDVFFYFSDMWTTICKLQPTIFLLIPILSLDSPGKKLKRL